jgi:hypothetical protein
MVLSPPSQDGQSEDPNLSAPRWTQQYVRFFLQMLYRQQIVALADPHESSVRRNY